MQAQVLEFAHGCAAIFLDAEQVDLLTMAILTMAILTIAILTMPIRSGRWRWM